MIWALLLLVSLGGLTWWGVAAFKALGRWLIVADPLEQADAIVVLNGHLGLRAAEAATIYRAGWADQVWLTYTSDPARVSTAAQPLHGDENGSWPILERMGVPRSAIRVVPTGARNTMEELQVVAREARRERWESRDRGDVEGPHPTGQGDLASRGRGGERAIVRYAQSDRFDGERWWERSAECGVVWHEVLGLMNVWAGFPAGPNGIKPAAAALR